MLPTDPLPPPVVTAVGDRVHVEWADHRCVVTRAWFDELAEHRSRTIGPVQLWDGDLELPTFAHHELVGGPSPLDSDGRVDELDADRAALALIEAMARFGVARVTGAPSEPGHAERFIARWVPLREVAFGRIHDVRADPAGYNVAHTAEALPPHNDMASYAAPPGGQVIHMLVNDAAGGLSTLVDGWAAARQLSEADREVLSSVSVPFRQFDVGVETWTRAPLLRVDEQGAIVQIRYSNQLMQSLEPDHPRAHAFYDAYRRLTELLLDRERQVRFRLGAGELLLLHGHRVLHGRTRFRPGTGARHLQDVYYEHEDLLNHARVLAARVGPDG